MVAVLRWRMRSIETAPSMRRGSSDVVRLNRFGVVGLNSYRVIHTSFQEI